MVKMRFAAISFNASLKRISASCEYLIKNRDAFALMKRTESTEVTLQCVIDKLHGALLDAGEDATPKFLDLPVELQDEVVTTLGDSAGFVAYVASQG